MIPTIKGYRVVGFETDGNGECIIPNGIKSIATGAFFRCKELKKIDIPDSVEDIGDGAFCSCNGLTDINLPKKLVVIWNNLFACCGNLKNINIPDSVKVIHTNAFGQCLGLENITIPNSVEGIDSDIFERCLNLINLKTSEQVFDKLYFADQYLVISNFIKKYSDKNTYTKDDINRYKKFILLTKRKWLLDLEYNVRMMTEHEKAFGEYILDEKMEQIIKHYILPIIKDKTLLYFLLNNMGTFFTFEEICKLIDISVKFQEVESTALLLNYRNKHFEYQNSLDELNRETKSKKKK